MSKKLITILLILFSILIVFIIYILTHQNKKIISYIESTDVIINPLMGWAPNALYKDYSQPHTLVYANLYWNEIEPIEGFYNFDYIEEKINYNYWKENNVKIIFRIILDYPNENNEMHIPQWLYDQLNGDGTWYDIEYGRGFSPNYENIKLISYHEKLIQALSKKYNDDNTIAFIAIGSIGHWGEFHTYNDKNIIIPFPSEEYYNQYIYHYIKYFNNKKLLIRRPLNIANNNNLGLFNDMLGNTYSTNEFEDWINSGYIDYLTNIEQPSMIDFWKTAPSGGEFASGNSGLNYVNNNSINDTLDQIRKTHITYIGPNCPANQDNNYSNNYEQILKTLGYRFSVKKLITSKNIFTNKLKISLTLENTGVAPFYYPWQVKIVILDKNNELVYEKTLDTDVTTWLPGTININSTLKLNDLTSYNKYSLAIGIIDPSTNEPSITFANNEPIINGYLKLLTLE